MDESTPPCTCCIMLDREKEATLTEERIESVQKTVEQGSGVTIQTPDMGKTHDHDIFMFRCTKSEAGALKRWFADLLRAGWRESPESVWVGDVQIYDVQIADAQK